MLDFDREEYCCGCGVCANVCSSGAIVMKAGEEGFAIPEIDTAKCVSCGQCENVCPHLRGASTRTKGPDMGTWLFASKDGEAKKRSSSGAAFYDLAHYCLEHGGSVCGCAWDESLRAVHILGHDEKALNRMQGSKYVQSETGMIYRHALEEMESGKTVLFSGTPCQAVAMHRYVLALGGRRERLVNVGVICHGIASPSVWESYKEWAEKEHGSPLVGVNFRDKSREGYKKSYCRYEYADGNPTYLPSFLPSFLPSYIEATLVYNLAMRKSCSHCDCKGINTAIDIMLGDWYAEHRGEGELGTSCVIAFTKAGAEYATKALSGLKPFAYENVRRDNRFIEDSVTLGKNRRRFFEAIRDGLDWRKIEKLYPPKRRVKKLLVGMGIFNFIKKMKDRMMPA